VSRDCILDNFHSEFWNCRNVYIPNTGRYRPNFFLNKIEQSNGIGIVGLAISEKVLSMGHRYRLVALY